MEFEVNVKIEEESVKGRIVSAAWKLFYDKGYDNATVGDIIELSGTSKGSFYHYFNSKDELLGTLSDILDDYYEKLSEKLDEVENYFDKLLYLNVEAHVMLQERTHIELLAMLYSTQLISKGARHLLDQNRVYYKLITKIIEQGQRMGHISMEKTVSEITKYYALCERAIIYDWCLNKGEYSLKEYSQEYMPIMMGRFKL